MEVDLTIKEVLQELKEEYAREGIEITTQEIYNIVDSQFRAASICMSKGLEVRIPIFGSLKRIYKKDIVESIKETDLTNIAEENELNEAILASKLKFLQKRRSKQEVLKDKVKTIKDLKEIDDLTKVNHSYKRIVDGL